MSRLAVRSARRGMRIMSADVVPGVAKSARNGGGQVTQKLTPTAAAGADRLKQMVAQGLMTQDERNRLESCGPAPGRWKVVCAWIMTRVAVARP